MIDYPYMLSNNKILPIILGLQTAAKPSKFTQEFLKNIGFTSSNDRAIVPLFKKLGFLTDDSVPTVYYDQLRDKTQCNRILAMRMKELYSELFTINTEIYNDNDENIKGAISRVTGGDEKSVTRVFNTFKALCNIADFSQYREETETEPVAQTDIPLPIADEKKDAKKEASFHYNIQIHLPATTDISVYNAIFKSLKDNLII